MDYSINCNISSSIDISFGEVGCGFSEMNSRMQAIFLHEIFDYLKHACKDDFSFENQLCFIARDIKHKNLKELIETLEKLTYFLKDENEKEKT